MFGIFKNFELDTLILVGYESATLLHNVLFPNARFGVLQVLIWLSSSSLNPVKQERIFA